MHLIQRTSSHGSFPQLICLTLFSVRASPAFSTEPKPENQRSPARDPSFDAYIYGQESHPYLNLLQRRCFRSNLDIHHAFDPPPSCYHVRSPALLCTSCTGCILPQYLRKPNKCLANPRPAARIVLNGVLVPAYLWREQNASERTDTGADAEVGREDRGGSGCEAGWDYDVGLSPIYETVFMY